MDTRSLNQMTDTYPPERIQIRRRHRRGATRECMRPPNAPEQVGNAAYKLYPRP